MKGKWRLWKKGRMRLSFFMALVMLVSSLVGIGGESMIVHAEEVTMLDDYTIAQGSFEATAEYVSPTAERSAAYKKDTTSNANGYGTYTFVYQAEKSDYDSWGPCAGMIFAASGTNANYYYMLNVLRQTGEIRITRIMDNVQKANMGYTLPENFDYTARHTCIVEYHEGTIFKVTLDNQELTPSSGTKDEATGGYSGSSMADWKGAYYGIASQVDNYSNGSMKVYSLTYEPFEDETTEPTPTPEPESTMLDNYTVTQGSFNATAEYINLNGGPSTAYKKETTSDENGFGTYTFEYEAARHDGNGPCAGMVFAASGTDATEYYMLNVLRNSGQIRMTYLNNGQQKSNMIFALPEDYDYSAKHTCVVGYHGDGSFNVILDGTELTGDGIKEGVAGGYTYKSFAKLYGTSYGIASQVDNYEKGSMKVYNLTYEPFSVKEEIGIMREQDDISNYSVIYPAGCDESILVAATLVRDKIAEIIGADVELADDSTGESDCEVLVGLTNRAESETAKSKLSEMESEDYIITRVDKKVVLYSDNAAAYKVMPDYFFQTGFDTERPVKLIFDYTYVGSLPSFEIKEDTLGEGTRADASFVYENEVVNNGIFVGIKDESANYGYVGYAFIFEGNKVVFYEIGETMEEMGSRVVTPVEAGGVFSLRLEAEGDICRAYYLDDGEGYDPWPEFELIIDTPEGSGVGIIGLNTDGTELKAFTASDYEVEDNDSTYTNAVFDEGADPDVLYYDGKYYMYLTGDNQSYPVYVSDDLVNWVEHDEKAVEGGFWGITNQYWAPDVEYINGKFYMVVTCGERIGMAVSDSPLGPFEPLHETVLYDKKCIDGHLFQDDDGKVYLYYVGLDEGQYIMGVELDTENNMMPIAETKKSLFKFTASWEGSVNEGPFMLKHNGTYYMTYSGQDYRNPKYAVGYATSDSPLGTFIKSETNPIFIGNSQVYGAGHHCFTTTENGELIIVYHTHQSTTSGGYDRKICIDRARFSVDADGAERLEIYGPTITPQLMPVISQETSPSVEIDAAQTDDIYAKDQNGVVTIYCQGALSEFISVEMDGEVVDSANYTLTEGSTIVEFDSEYLDTLSQGTHSVTLNYTEGRTAQTTLLILETSEYTGYGVVVSEDTAIMAGETAQVQIKVLNGDETVTTYNAYDVAVTFDAEKLTYVSATAADAMADITVTDNTIRIIGYGADKAIDTPVVALKFEAKTSGQAEVTLTSAKIDASANANVSDAPVATVFDSVAYVQVKGYQVTLGQRLGGAEYSEIGGSYTFTATDAANYDYVITATMDETAVDVTDNGNGTYTINNVTGVLAISAAMTPKSYDVVVNGTAAADVTAGNTATYNTPYIFTVSKADGYTYTVDVTIGGSTYQLGAPDESGAYTISGTDITGRIVITVNKTVTPANQYNVEKPDWVEGAATVEEGMDYTFTVNVESGYLYGEVTVSVDETDITEHLVVNGTNSYTIPAQYVTGAIKIELTRTVDITVEVTSYITLNEKVMYLITASGVTEEGKVMKYDGMSMYWSGVYNAYAHLVVSSDGLEIVKTTAEEKVTYAEGTAAGTVVYTGDVNGTGILDVNDAQLTYDMYNVKYETFDTVSMQKFLNADVNGDKIVNVNDAAAVVVAIKSN